MMISAGKVPQQSVRYVAAAGAQAVSVQHAAAAAVEEEKNHRLLSLLQNQLLLPHLKSHVQELSMRHLPAELSQTVGNLTGK